MLKSLSVATRNMIGLIITQEAKSYNTGGPITTTTNK